MSAPSSFIGRFKRRLIDARVAAGSLRYWGLRYQCPICGHRFREMLTSSHGALDAWCPRCWSAERHRVLWLYLQRELMIEHGPSRVLHVAPERGLGRRLRSLGNLEYISTDVGERDPTVRADLTALPFADGSFDLVLCSHVLEHIPDDRLAMSEMRRVLAPDGRVVMQHPIDRHRAETFEDWSIDTPEERVRVFFQHDHVRIYGRDIEQRLREAGFSVRIVHYADQLTVRERTQFRLDQQPGADPSKDLEADAIYLLEHQASGDKGPS